MLPLVPPIGEENRAAQLPHIFRGIGVTHALGEAVLVVDDLQHGVGAPLQAVRLLAHGGVIARGGVSGQPPLPFEGVLEQPAMKVDRMRLVAPVLHHLEPVAGQPVADDLPQFVFPLAEIQPGQEGGWLWPQIGPDQAPHLLHFVRGRAHPVLKSAVRRRQRLLQAAPRAVEAPAMVGTAQPHLFRNAEGHVHGAMGTPRPNQPQGPTAVPEEHQILPQNAHRAHRVGFQLHRGRNRVPVAPHQLSAWRARPHAG